MGWGVLVPTSGRQGVAEQPETFNTKNDAHALKTAADASDFDDCIILLNDMQKNLNWKWPYLAKQLTRQGLIGETRAGQGLITSPHVPNP